MLPLFHSPIDLAHKYWKQLLIKGDLVIDATCGNGHDTRVLAELVLTADSGSILAFDLQHEAIQSSQKLLLKQLSQPIYQRIRFFQACHSQFPPDLLPDSVKLVVYNLGYLPGGNKSKTTLADTTLRSIVQAQTLLQEGGMISITCYPGHKEGALEEERVLEMASTLDPKKWYCCFHRWLNRLNAPSLLLFQKNSQGGFITAR